MCTFHQKTSRKLVGCVGAALAIGALLVNYAGVAWAQASRDAVVPAVAAQADAPDIIGGREAMPGAWPWQAALVSHMSSNDYDGQFCGGSLIATDWVLTAAHCVEGVEASLLDLVVGAHRLTDPNPRDSR